MANGRFVTYMRVSTDRQGRSGLGLDAQRKAVADYLNGGRWKVVGEFVEIESGRKNDRPKLKEAFALCRVMGARLLVAKLDRLSRDAAFLLSLQDAGIEFVACDMPDANRMTVGILASVAEYEREQISARTKAALAAAKARGQTLGGFHGHIATREAGDKGRAVRMAAAADKASALTPLFADMARLGIVTLAAIAEALNERGVPTATGKGDWTAAGVARVKARIQAAETMRAATSI